MNVSDIIKKLKLRQRQKAEARATEPIAEEIKRPADAERRAALEELAAYDQELGI